MLQSNGVGNPSRAYPGIHMISQDDSWGHRERYFCCTLHSARPKQNSPCVLSSRGNVGLSFWWRQICLPPTLVRALCCIAQWRPRSRTCSHSTSCRLSPPASLPARPRPVTRSPRAQRRRPSTYQPFACAVVAIHSKRAQCDTTPESTIGSSAYSSMPPNIAPLHVNRDPDTDDLTETEQP